MKAYFNMIGLYISGCDEFSTKAYQRFCNNHSRLCPTCLGKLEDPIEKKPANQVSLPTGRTLVLFKEE